MLILLMYLVQGQTLAFLNEKYSYEKKRGMSWWHDQINWIGGYPHEDARPEEMFRFLHKQGYLLKT